MRGHGGLARAADRSCGVPRVVVQAAPLVPRTMRGAQSAWRRKRAACKGTRRLVRAIPRAVVHTLNPLENQSILHSVTIVRDWSDNCQVLWNACPALSRPVNADGARGAGDRRPKSMRGLEVHPPFLPR
jgi:hypothetical protein